jgi:proline dehydrogenase
MSLRRRAHFWLATSRAFERAVHTSPALRDRAWRSARRYVAGPTVADAVAVSGRLAAVGLGASVDLFGERTSPAEAEAVTADYERLCETLAAATAPSTWLSLDLSHMALARQLTDAGADVALATHDPPLRAQLLAELPDARCELLLGVLPSDAVALAAAGRDTRIYVPYGPDWLRFLLRRRAESQGA